MKITDLKKQQTNVVWIILLLTIGVTIPISDYFHNWCNVTFSIVCPVVLAIVALIIYWLDGERLYNKALRKFKKSYKTKKSISEFIFVGSYLIKAIEMEDRLPMASFMYDYLGEKNLGNFDFKTILAVHSLYSADIGEFGEIDFAKRRKGVNEVLFEKIQYEKISKIQQYISSNAFYNAFERDLRRLNIRDVLLKLTCNNLGEAKSLIFKVVNDLLTKEPEDIITAFDVLSNEYLKNDGSPKFVDEALVRVLKTWINSNKDKDFLETLVRVVPRNTNCEKVMQTWARANQVKLSEK